MNVSYFFRILAAVKLAVLVGLVLFAQIERAEAAMSPYGDDFQSVLASNDHVVVHVHANWCLTCAKQDPILQEIANSTSYDTLASVRVNFDTDKDFLKQYKVVAQSTIIFFEDGKEVNRLIGVTSKDKIRDAVDALVK